MIENLLSLRKFKFGLLSKKSVKVTALIEVHKKVEVALVLRESPEPDQERMLYHAHHLDFRVNMLYEL